MLRTAHPIVAETAETPHFIYTTCACVVRCPPRNGNMAGTGSVAWIFTTKGYILIDKEQIGEEELFSVAVDAGAEDIKSTDKNYEVYCDPKDFENVKAAIQGKGVKWENADLTMLPNSTIKLSGPDAKQVLGLIEALEDHDDVQKVYSNFDIPDEILEEIAQEL